MLALERLNQKWEFTLKYHLGCSIKKITGFPRPRSINKFKMLHNYLLLSEYFYFITTFCGLSDSNDAKLFHIQPEIYQYWKKPQNYQRKIFKFSIKVKAVDLTCYQEN